MRREVTGGLALPRANQMASGDWQGSAVEPWVGRAWVNFQSMSPGEGQGGKVVKIWGAAECSAEGRGLHHATHLPVLLLGSSVYPTRVATMLYFLACNGERLVAKTSPSPLSNLSSLLAQEPPTEDQGRAGLKEGRREKALDPVPLCAQRGCTAFPSPPTALSLLTSSAKKGSGKQI